MDLVRQIAALVSSISWTKLLKFWVGKGATQISILSVRELQAHNLFSVKEAGVHFGWPNCLHSLLTV